MVFRYSNLIFIRTIVLLLAVTITIYPTNILSFELSTENNTKMAAGRQIFGCDFEVFGKVQGVFFRKHTEKKAKSLGVHGWCMNTELGTVKGQLEAPLAEINEMKFWLQNRGSPKSIIERAEFSPTKEISIVSFKTFTIKR